MVIPDQCRPVWAEHCVHVHVHTCITTLLCKFSCTNVHVHVHVVILSQIGLTVNRYKLLYLHPIIYFSYIVFSELLNRVLGLEGDECDPVESKMTVTVFQFAAYFLSIGSTKAIPKSLKQVAQESESFSECLQLFIIRKQKNLYMYMYMFTCTLCT